MKEKDYYGYINGIPVNKRCLAETRYKGGSSGDYLLKRCPYLNLDGKCEHGNCVRKGKK